MKDNQLDTNSTKNNNVWYFLLIVYLFFDYARLHNTFHIEFARPLMMLTIFFVFMIIKNGNLFFFKYHQIKFLWLFIFLLSLYIPFAYNNYLAFNATKTMILYMPFIISTIICVNTIGRLKNFIFFNVIIMAYISIYAITHGGHGPGNYLFDENDLALYINIWIAICYFLFWDEQQFLRKIIYAITLIIGLIAIISSFSRGGFLGLIAVSLVIWFFSQKKFLTLMFLTIFALLFFLFTSSDYRTEMSTVTDTKESTASKRIESWKSGWNMFMDNPLGVGGQNFPVRFPEYQTDFFLRGMWGTVAHSLWVTLIAELGIAGIIIYMMILYYNLKDIFFIKNTNLKNNKDFIFLNNLGCGLIGTMAGYFTSATFLSVLYYAHFWYLTGLIVAAANIANQLKNIEFEDIAHS